LYYCLSAHILAHEHNIISNNKNAAGVVVDAEAVAVVAGQGASHPPAGPGQRWKDDADEKTRFGGRVAHNSHARLQHQVRAGGRHETERVGHWRAAQDKTVLAQLFRVHRYTSKYIILLLAVYYVNCGKINLFLKVDIM